MKKIFILALFFIGLSATSKAQIGKESSGRKTGFFHRIFHPRENKPRAQMHHFDRPKRDPNIKHNGTAYWRQRRKDRQKKENDIQFSTPSQSPDKKRNRK